MKTENNGSQEIAKLSNRNLISFSVGTIGRDMVVVLFFVHLINYILFTKSLTSAQFTAITLIMAISRIIDAINDPIMGNILDTTHTRWGKFKPWIAAGMISTVLVVIASFNNGLQGWSYVVFFAFMYILFSITFTMNDIAYWGMLPSLSSIPSDRNKITSLAVLCANIGGAVTFILVPILTIGAHALHGSAVKAFAFMSLVLCVFFIMLQSVTLFGVKENPLPLKEKTESVSFKQIINIFKENDQLKWVAIVFFLTQLSVNLLFVQSIYIYLSFGYEGFLITLFGLLYGAATFLVFVSYTLLSKRFTRKQFMRFSLITIILGNGLMLIFGLFVPGDIGTFSLFGSTINLKFTLMAFANLFCGIGNPLFYLILMICIANTVEYNDYISGKRNEGIIFSTRPFLTKLGTAVGQFMGMIFFVIIGIRATTNQISDLENAAALGQINSEEKLMQITEIIGAVPIVQNSALLIFMTMTPALLFTWAYIIYRKRFKLDEKYYMKMIDKIKG